AAGLVLKSGGIARYCMNHRIREPGDVTLDLRTDETVSTITESAGLASPVMRSIASPLDRAIDRARQCLLSKQAPEGYWCAELQGDSILESEYILTRFILDQEDDPRL